MINGDLKEVERAVMPKGFEHQVNAMRASERAAHFQANKARAENSAQEPIIPWLDELAHCPWRHQLRNIQSAQARSQVATFQCIPRPSRRSLCGPDRRNQGPISRLDRKSGQGSGGYRAVYHELRRRSELQPSLEKVKQSVCKNGF